MWRGHALPTSAWVFSGSCGSLPRPEDVTRGEPVCPHCPSLRDCGGCVMDPMTDGRPVQGAFCLAP